MKKSLLAAMAVGLCAVPAYAGFNLNPVVTNLTGPTSRFTVSVHNAGLGGTFGNGINTNSSLQGVSLRAVVNTPTGPARKMYWIVSDDTGPGDIPDGEPDTLDIYNVTGIIVPAAANSGGHLRAAGSTLGAAGSNVHAGIQPYPRIVANNPWQQGSNYFEGAVVQITINNTLANSSPGYEAIKLIVDDGAAVRISGRLGGNAGPDVAYSLDINGAYTNGAPYLDLAQYYVDGVVGENFSMTTDAIDPDLEDVTVTLTGPVPDFISLVTTPGAPAEFTIENNRPLTVLDVGVHPVIIRATDPNGAYTDTEIGVRITVIPEPVSLTMLGGISLMALRRRRD